MTTTTTTTEDRCGTYAGACAHWARREPMCGPCTRACKAYKVARELDALAGRPRSVSVVGSKRRIEAMLAVGWSHAEIGAVAGMGRGWSAEIRRLDGAMRRSTAETVARVFDHLAHQHPAPAPYRVRRLRRAAREGWLPASAWFDIDDPAEDPVRDAYRPSWRPPSEVDVVVVDRLLAYDWSLAASSTRAERVLVVAGWVDAGRPLRELEQATGWRAARYRTPADDVDGLGVAS